METQKEKSMSIQTVLKTSRTIFFFAKLPSPNDKDFLIKKSRPRASKSRSSKIVKDKKTTKPFHDPDVVIGQSNPMLLSTFLFPNSKRL